jgi:AcrR family transcriptional regulator
MESIYCKGTASSAARSVDGAMRGPRRYDQKLRAEASAETRRRITEAAVDLHDSVGPARTTVAEIARRAGVQRLTVYHHFPDESSLFEACTSHWFAGHPPPDPASMAVVGSRSTRVRRGLNRVYGYYRENETMFAHWLRDAELIPELAVFAEVGYHGYLRDVCDALVAPTRGSADARRTLLVALQFHTWRLLARREGMSDRNAARLMGGMVEDLILN